MPSHRRQEPSNRTETQIVAGAQEQPAAEEQQQAQGSTHTPANPAHRARSPAQPQRVPQWPGSTDAWQGVVYKNDKAWGRLASPPRVQTSPLEGAGAVAQVLSIVWSGVQDRRQTPLSVLVDAEFQASKFAFQIFCGSTCVFSAPVPFSGSEVAASISQHRQRIEYIRQHSLNFSSSREAGNSAQNHEGHSTAPLQRACAEATQQEYVFERGDSCAGFALAFDLGASVAQLSRVEFKLAVVHTSSPLDEPPAVVSSSSSERADRNSNSSTATDLADHSSSTVLRAQGGGEPAPAIASRQGGSAMRWSHSPSRRDAHRSDEHHKQQQAGAAQHALVAQQGTAQGSPTAQAPVHSAIQQELATERMAGETHLSSPGSQPASSSTNITAMRNVQPSKQLYMPPHHRQQLAEQRQAQALAEAQAQAQVQAQGHAPASAALQDTGHGRLQKRSMPAEGVGSPPLLDPPHSSPKNGKVGITLPVPAAHQNGRLLGGRFPGPSGDASDNGHLNGHYERAGQPQEAVLDRSAQDPRQEGLPVAASLPHAPSAEGSRAVSSGQQLLMALQHPHSLAAGPGIGSRPVVASAISETVDRSVHKTTGVQQPSSLPPADHNQAHGHGQGQRSSGAVRSASFSGNPSAPGSLLSVESAAALSELQAEVVGQAGRPQPPQPPQQPRGWEQGGAATAPASPHVSASHQTQPSFNAWVGGAPGGSSASASSYSASGRPRSKHQQSQQLGATAGGRGSGAGNGAKQGAWVGGPRSSGGPMGSRHGGGGMSSRGSSPALPTYRDEGGSGVERVGTPGCSTPPEPASTADLERFILQVTPMLSLDASQPLDQALQDLSLDDVWRFYLEPSLYGREVYTLGGMRGPSLCYFVPYLSAIQLFTPASPKDGPGTSRMYVSDTEGWPKHMHLKFEHFEHEMPFNRTPLYEHIEQLAAESSRQEAQRERDRQQQAAQQQDKDKDRQQAISEDGSDAGGKPLPVVAGSPVQTTVPFSPPPVSSPPNGSATPSEAASTPPSSASIPRPMPASPMPGQLLHSSFLRDARIVDLHPASWFSVAWYPVYRIPDAPLCARFLTFHSFAPMVISMQRAHAALVEEGLHRPVAIMPLQVVGLKWYNMQGERWLEALSDPAVGSTQLPGRRGFNPEWQGEGGNGGGGGRPPRRQAVPQMDAAWQAHLGELQVTAERLARGYGLRVLGQMGAEDVKLRHPDYEFFNTRS